MGSRRGTTTMPEPLPSLRRTQSHAMPGSALVAVLMAVVVVGALYFGREALMPIALAVLLSFVLSPLVRLLQGWRIPRSIAVAIVALAAFSAIFGLGALMVGQINELAGSLPRYQSTLREKIQTLRGAAAGTRTLERASEVLQDLGREIERPRTQAAPSSAVLGEAAIASRPVPVEIRQPDPGALQTIGALIAPLVQPIATTGIVVVFVLFILLQQKDLRNRLIRLAGAHDLQRTTAALDDVGERLSRLFLSQLALNAGFGLVIGACLWLIGVPSAPLWGMLAAILRFVPYIGGLISAVFPLVLAAAVGPDWSMVLWTAALFLIVEPVVGHMIEPLVYGRSSGLSPVAVVASATFWTWLWGPVGLILATPLTVCLVVLGRHVDRLHFLEVMLGDRPPLTPAELTYQRMLARDPVEVVEQAQSFLRDKPLVAYYDEILLEGLRLAEADAAQGLLDDERMQQIRDAVAEILDDLTTHEDAIAADEPEAAEEKPSPLAHLQKIEAQRDPVALPEGWSSERAVLCIPGDGELDAAAAMMIAQLVTRKGIGAQAEDTDALSLARIFAWDATGTALTCLCYTGCPTAAQVRYALRRIQRKAPETGLVVALLGRDCAIDEDQLAAGAGLVRHSLRATVDRILAIAVASGRPERSVAPPPTAAVVVG
jgi:predicted PurR-regulated permease PerM